MEDKVFAQVRAVMARVFDVDASRITDETRAADIEGWDSLTHLIVLTGIERRLAVKLPMEEAYAAQNVGALVSLVRGCLPQD